MDAIGGEANSIVNRLYLQRAKPASGTSVAANAPASGGTTTKPTYRQAYHTVFNQLKAKYGNMNGGWKHGITNQKIRKRINTALKAAQIFPPKKRPKPRKPPPRRGGRPAGYWK